MGTLIGKAKISRNTWNMSMFILSYIVSNLVSGIIYDTYINYLQEVSLSVATSFWAFYGYATFISAFILILIPKIGYKKLLIFSSLASSVAILGVIKLKSTMIFYISTLLVLISIQLHYTMLSPYIATYSKDEEANKIKWYTKTYYMGHIGYFLTTFLGGAIVVKFFSIRLGQNYEYAKLLTENMANMNPFMKEAYIQGNKDVLLITAIVSMISIIPVILIKENKNDYYLKNNKNNKSLLKKSKEILKAIIHKDSLIYMIYWAMISFGMGLFSSYYTVFLNRNLNIDKVTSSQLVSLSYLAIVVFMVFTPILVKKCGQIVTLGGVSLLSIPFMLLIANGDKFGKYTVLVVGLSLFIRSGLMNLSSPIDSSLSMDLVEDKYRPAYTSVLNIVAGLASIASGIFTGKVLFLTQEGYKDAYYIAAVIYAIACTLLLIGLWKYNKSVEKK